MLPKACLLCIAALLSGVMTQNLNNLDDLEPTMRVSPDRPSPELPGVNDYFGWTAIFHNIQATIPEDTLAERVAKTRLLVGAPFGTFPGGLGYTDVFAPRVEQTGLVYNCPVTMETCEGVRGDTNLYVDNADSANQVGANIAIESPTVPDQYAEGRLFDQAPDALVTLSGGTTVFRLDHKERQLLGSAMYSTGDEFIACAPRYRWDLTSTASTPPRELPIGICYSSGRELIGFLPKIPCINTGTYNDQRNSGEGFCLGGFSAIINNDNFVVGAPGNSQGRGSLEAAPVSGGNFAGRAIAESGLQDQYEGFQAVGAYMTVASNSGQPQNLVTSAPKFGTEYKGALFYFDSTATITTSQELTCGGTQMAEFFGYSLAATDINNDMFDEIIVGAPMYTDFSTNRVEKGRVYFFVNNAGSLMCDPSDTVVIDGPSSLPRSSRFGSSLAALGDIDNDGYPDFAVGAPYYRTASSANTGAVFIYYGRFNISDLPNQIPFVITADTMANNVNLNGANLLTFGWSLSSRHDVDNNGYNDLLVGAYESQSVFLLRTLPVADVTVYFLQHDIVDIDRQSNFTLEIQASFTGESVIDTLSVNFELRERVQVVNRVFFNAELTSTIGTGQFSFSAQNTNVSATVTIFTLRDISDFENFIFDITLLQVDRTVATPVSGSQTITSLDAFPKIRHGGETNTMVPVQNFCGSDGCISDVTVVSITPMELPVVANDPTVGTLALVIENIGAEPALNLGIRMSDIPSYVTGVSAASNLFTCDVIVNATTTCQFSDRRINNGDSLNVMVRFTYNPGNLIGNETESDMNLLLVVPEESNNRDSNTANNGGSVTFAPTAVADLSVEMTFMPNPAEYTGEAPVNINQVGIAAFDTDVTLLVNVINQGPSTIQSGSLTVLLPSANPVITSANTFIYPYDIRPGAAVFECERAGLDPSSYVGISSGRRRRSAKARAQLRESMSRDTVLRTKRQANPINFDLDCNQGSPSRGNCTMFTCSITNMRSERLAVRFITSLDERFYSSLDEEDRRMFRLRAYAEVTINNDYIQEDNTTNNRISGDLLIQEFVQTDTQPDLLHAILWPVLGGVLLLIVLIIVLYFCGFFRRKRKGDLDIEGVEDFPEEHAKAPPPRESTYKEPIDVKDD